MLSSERAAWGRVSVGGEVVGELPSPGLVVLVGVTHSDDGATAARMADTLWNLRILADDEGRMNRSCAELGRPLLVVSQFTLYGDTSKGRRPSWIDAAPGAVAEPLVEAVVTALRVKGAEVATGRFGAEMAVELGNDGPVTIIIDIG